MSESIRANSNFWDTPGADPSPSRERYCKESDEVTYI